MAIRTALPWYWRWLGLVLFALIILMFSRAAYDFGMKFAGHDSHDVDREVERRVEETTQRMQPDLEHLRADLAQSTRDLQMERAMHADVIKQMKALADQNATLKEDVAFLQTVMPSSGGKVGGVAINRFLVQNEPKPGEYRYRLLLTQTGQRSTDFHGSLQFLVSLQQENKKSVITLPGESDKDVRPYSLNFRFYQRVDGAFRVPAGAVLKSMQVRVFEQGSREPKLTETANLP